jgi:hypothetical protein
MTTIPASLFNEVTPSVLAAGGAELAITGLVITENYRVPIGSVLSFPSVPAVADYFGPTSNEAIIAGGGSGMGSGYFGGFTGADALPGALLFAQYPVNAVPAWLQGGDISALPLATLQGYSGTLSIVINGVTESAAVNLSAATSFSSAAQIIQNDLGITGIQTASFTGSIAGSVLTVTGVASGTIGTGNLVAGTGVAAGTYITSLGSGTGGNGTYNLSNSQTAPSAPMTSTAAAVTYDSVSGSFFVFSGLSGTGSTIAYATGAMAANLLMTQATGAVLSQGAAAATPAAFMNGVVNVTTAWVTYMTAFNPDGTTGLNTQKQAFAAWKNTFPNRYMYVCWDTDITPTESVPATESLGYILQNNEDSGTFLIYEPSDLNQAAFICGLAASIDFSETNGHTTFAFKGQVGLVPGVTSSTVAINLAGNPQASLSFGNGYNYYGAVADATQSFQWLQRGTVTGPWTWADTYIEQIWLNANFQNALDNLQNNAKSIPYTTAGSALIEAALSAPINAGLNFGAFAPGTLSPTQIQQVNTQAGANVAGTLQSQGYYLQVNPASAAARNARTTPPATFFYISSGSVQAINLASVALL